jgi:FtsH-binding integral membrane protein
MGTSNFCQPCKRLTANAYFYFQINHMIQRIQSIWLLIVALAAFATYTLTLYVGKQATGSEMSFLLADNFLLVILIILLGMLAVICIFLFKNRKLQFRLSVLGVILSLVFVFLEYVKVEDFKTKNSIAAGSYQLGALLPILMVVFFFLAARGIYKDEKLVKSLNRLR